MAATRTLAVVAAGLSQPSSTSLLADRLTAAARSALEARGVDVQLVTVELREHAHDLTDHLLTGFATEVLQDAKDAVAGADGVIAVTPIYSGSYNGLFKTFFDLLDEGVLRGTPVLLGATAGTPRHSLALEHALRPLFAYLGALTVPTAVFAATADFGGGDDVDSGLVERIARAGEELADLVAGREQKEEVDPFTVTTPFEELLKQH